MTSVAKTLSFAKSESLKFGLGVAPSLKFHLSFPCKEIKVKISLFFLFGKVSKPRKYVLLGKKKKMAQLI